MNRLLLVLLGVLLLACGGSDPASPSVPGGGYGDPVTPADNPLVASWTVTELTIVGAEGDTMSQSSPNATGAAVFTATDADIDVSLFGQPTVDEAGPYTFDTTAAVLTVQTGRGAKTWGYTIAGNILTLEGVRSSGSEQLHLKITAAR